MVSIHSLATGERLPLGLDQDGVPVFQVYSGPEGRFEVYLPETEQGAVRAEARVAEQLDAGVSAEALVTPLAQADLDEDTATIARYIRAVFTQRLETLLYQPTTPDSPIFVGANLPTDIRTTIAAGLSNWHATALRTGLAAAEPARRRAAAQTLADLVLGRVGLEDATLARLTPPYDGPEEPPLSVLVAEIRDVREEVAGVMRADLAAGRSPAARFAALAEVRLAAAGGLSAALVRPGSYPEFLIARFMGDGSLSEEARYERISAMGREFGLDGNVARLRAAASGLLTHIGLRLVFDAPLNQAVLARLEGL